MTEERAAALAWQFDLRRARAFMSDKRAWVGPFGIKFPSAATFAGQFAGGLIDPVNYLPIFGPAARAAAVARFGARVYCASAPNSQSMRRKRRRTSRCFRGCRPPTAPSTATIFPAGADQQRRHGSADRRRHASDCASGWHRRAREQGGRHDGGGSDRCAQFQGR